MILPGLKAFFLRLYLFYYKMAVFFFYYFFYIVGVYCEYSVL